jgi:hypothetical protein
VLSRIESRSGARTSLFVPELNQLLVAAPARSGNEAQLMIYKKNKIMKRTLFISPVIISALLVCSGTAITNNKTTMNDEYTTGKDTVINFQNSEVDKVPIGFTQAATGKLQRLEWKVKNEKGNKVVAQSAKNEGDYFNLLIMDKPSYQNITLSVKIKAVTGVEDQGGGLVWRCIDKNNYYIARYNPLENNLRLYRVVDGNRKQLKSVECAIKTGEWVTMSIEMSGNKISCSLNNVKMIDATDDTFKSPGQIGLWTKADAVTYFDDLSIHSF